MQDWSFFLVMGLEVRHGLLVSKQLLSHRYEVVIPRGIKRQSAFTELSFLFPDSLELCFVAQVLKLAQELIFAPFKSTVEIVKEFNAVQCADFVEGTINPIGRFDGRND